MSALHDAEYMAARSATLHRYRHTSPHFILWGLVWLFGYALTDLLPGRSATVWFVCDGLGVLGALAISMRRPAGARADVNSDANSDANSGGKWRMLAAALTVAALAAAVIAIFPPLSGRQVSTLIALVVAAAYVLAGIWNGARIAIIGLLVGALSLFGFFVVGSHFNLWMAVVVGGALIAAGLWMRKI